MVRYNLNQNNKPFPSDPFCLCEKARHRAKRSFISKCVPLTSSKVYFQAAQIHFIKLWKDQLEDCFETGTRYLGNGLLHQGHQTQVMQLTNSIRAQSKNWYHVPGAEKQATSTMPTWEHMYLKSQRARAAASYHLGPFYTMTEEV